MGLCTNADAEAHTVGDLVDKLPMGVGEKGYRSVQ